MHNVSVQSSETGCLRSELLEIHVHISWIFAWPTLYSSKFLWHNIFVHFVINLEITKFCSQNLTFVRMSQGALYSALTEKWAGQH